ncbi:MAG: Ig-like domain-containing protein, partial [Gemmatimonadota bacterium]|nr:Ig-like domain-containing protein [Gemmatimonadota bacterium]
MLTYRTTRQLLLLAVLLLVFAALDFGGPNARAVVPLDLTPDDVVGNRACPGDFDNNGIVEFADFLSLVAVFGASSGDANYNALMDLDGNGMINFGDFVLFAQVFGTTCEPPPAVARVTVSPSSASIEEGGTQQFSATAYDSVDVEISGKTFVWSSDSASVATVDSSGLATGVDAGSTTITATVDGVSGTATLTVTEPPPVVARVTVSPSSVSIEEGGAQQFSATAYDSVDVEISGKTFVWSSDSASVATVDSSGLATGVDAGSTTITATADGVSGTATLTVTEAPPAVARVTVSPSSVSIEEGGTHQFNATAYTSDNTMISGKTFAWTSSSASVATINASGLATGVDAGSTTIRATVDGISGTATLTVTEAPPAVARVTVSPSSVSIEEGGTHQFNATAYTSDNTMISGKTFAWTSSSASVATINASGLATGVDAGSTTIRATVDGISGTATLTVTEAPPAVARVTVSPSSVSIEEGGTHQFNATAYTSDNTMISGKTFAWTSSSASVATINASGLATGVDAGSTTIRATVDGISGTATLKVTEPPPPRPVV